jgi:hypothetical protein
MRLWVTCTFAVGLAITGGLLGAAYAHHLAAKRILVAVKPVDHIGTVPSRFEVCAKLIDPGDCGYKPPPQKAGIRFEYVKDARFKDGALLVEFQHGDEEGLAMAQRFANSPRTIALVVKGTGRLPVRSAIPPILYGIVVGLSLAGLLGVPRYNVLRARFRQV